MGITDRSYATNEGLGIFGRGRHPADEAKSKFMLFISGVVSLPDPD